MRTLCAVIFMNTDDTEKEIKIQRPLISRLLARIRPTEQGDIPVSQVMTKGVIVISSTAPINKVAELMARNKIGSVIVMEKGRAVGIMTERDIVRKVVAKKMKFTTPVKKIMSTPMRVIEENQKVTDAVALMKKYKIKRLPVIDAQKRLVGIVTDTDITRAVPGIIDLISEVSDIQRFEATTESVGICNKCGLYSETLVNVGGEFLCEECREEEAATS